VGTRRDGEAKALKAAKGATGQCPARAAKVVVKSLLGAAPNRDLLMDATKIDGMAVVMMMMMM
jgi:hypothetical protein